ncbi:hypothetical protein KJ819_00250 [Patescibacteria group bacterium]|nr:hypothetical protein [Patescibacteria group bacterium]MBU1500630.1 hypothetical protein [Patescibacteria group bacterium]MBU2080527.1 hypothetical protein [Patescibacteria group bacterium]MBU2123668.1 hypothetical protein [Patescibacteria group bacterium]MBU2194524.1 hypothetical protein [Patescibacteria group bacterium]
MKNTSPTFLKKVAAVFLGIALIVPASVSVMPQRVEASGMPTLDVLNLVQNTFVAIKESALSTKEYILDGLANELATIAIQSMTKSLVNWINSGFQGSPAFVTDLETNLRGVGDAAARHFFNDLASRDITDSPFQDKILSTVRLGYYLSTSPESFYTRYPYTLYQVSPDARAFIDGDFSQGGFNAWFSAFMNPANNPYGAEELARQELSRVVSDATGNRIQELSWADGFMSWRGECREYTPQGEEGWLPGDELPADLSIDITGEDACADYEIETPGSVIVEQLNETLKAPNQKLITADEINEVIGALLNQLVGHVLGANGGGLRSVSRPSSGGGSSVLDQATNPNQASSNNSLSRNFTAAIASQKNYVNGYSAAWQKIKTAAEGALARCTNGAVPDPQEIIDRADLALAKAAEAIAALEDIEADIAAVNEAQGEQPTRVLNLSTKYQELMSSDILPSAEEIAEAQAESQDTGEARPGSLYSQLSRLSISNGCDASQE